MAAQAEQNTVEGQADELPPDDTTTPEHEAAPAPTGAELVRHAEGGGTIIRADEPDEIIEKATKIATSLSAMIEKQGLAVALDRRNPQRKHVEVGGWQALGAMLGALGGQPLHAETVWTRMVKDHEGETVRRTYTAEVKRYHSKAQGGGLRETVTYDVDGFDWEAKVEIRTPDGTIVGTAEAMCSRAESTWSRRDDYAVRSMAETRAESRAYRRAAGWIVSLAGYSPTPAEEMPPADAVELPAWAQEATNDRKKVALRALAFLLEPEPEDVSDLEAATAVAREALGKVKDLFGLVPEAVTGAIIRIAGHVQQQLEKADQDAAAERGDPPAPDPEPDPEPDDGPPDTPVAEGPGAGTIAQPEQADKTGPDYLKLLRDLGCKCDNPISTDPQTRKFNDDCPIAGHGIAF